MIAPLQLPAVAHWRCRMPALPKRQSRGRAVGLCGGEMVGATVGSGWRETPCWWPGGLPAPIPGGVHKRFVVARAGGGDIAGYWTRTDGGAGGALGWRLHDGHLDLRELHPASGWEWTRALGAGGGCVVGYGKPKAARGQRALERALCWTVDGQMIELPALEAGSEALAQGADGAWVVGQSGQAQGQVAVLWSCDGRGAVALGSRGVISEAWGVADGQQVGYFWARGGARAALWHGTAALLVDLTPAGSSDARALGCGAGLQVGVATPQRQMRSGGTNPLVRAGIWAGSASSWVDLQAVLPSPWNASCALAVGRFGNVLRVVGEAQQVVMEAEGTRQERYFLAAQVPVIWETSID